jgi:hypothetical protein
MTGTGPRYDKNQQRKLSCLKNDAFERQRLSCRGSLEQMAGAIEVDVQSATMSDPEVGGTWIQPEMFGPNDHFGTGNGSPISNRVGVATRRGSELIFRGRVWWCEKHRGRLRVLFQGLNLATIQSMMHAELDSVRNRLCTRDWLIAR